MGSKHGYKRKTRTVTKNVHGTFVRPKRGRPVKVAEGKAQHVLPDIDKPSSSGAGNSSSGRKLASTRATSESFPKSKNGLEDAVGYRMVDLDCLSSIISKYMKCPLCKCELRLCERCNTQRGFASKLTVMCQNQLCYFSEDFSTSSKISKLTKTKGDDPYEVNRRATMAFREIGKGRHAMVRFCAVMNMPPPLAATSVRIHNEALHDVYVAEAQSSMIKAAEQVREYASSDECGVSVDGTWQRRGRSSLNGVVAIEIKTGKVLDYEVLSRHCKGCQIWEKEDKTSPRYLRWKADHNCKINHIGSAGSMEPAGARRIWGRSVATRNLMYTSYIGDGDTKSFSSVVKDQPYGSTPIVKKECVGHIQKRVGGRIRTLKQKLGRTKLSDGAGIGGRGRLTQQKVDTLQNYFGIAIRGNKGDKAGMKRNIWASLYHVASTKKKPRHHKCPTGPDSWCMYNRDVANGSNVYKHTNGFPKAIIKVLKPIYKDLTKGELLNRCLDCYTQNNNESFNGTIWQRIPKEVYVGAMVMDIGVASAVIAFNDGIQGLLAVLTRQNIFPGKYSTNALNMIDKSRIRYADRQTLESTRKRRKAIRRIKKGYEDKHEEKEGVIYETGMGD